MQTVDVDASEAGLVNDEPGEGAEGDDADEADGWSEALAKFGRRAPVDVARLTATGSLRRAAIAGPVGVVMIVVGLLVGGVTQIAAGIGVIVLLVGLTALVSGIGWQIAVAKYDGMGGAAAPPDSTPPDGPAGEHATTRDWLAELRRRRGRVVAIALVVAIVPAGVLVGALAIADPHGMSDGVITSIVIVPALLFAAGIGTVLGIAIRIIVDGPTHRLLASKPWTRAEARGQAAIVATGNDRKTSVSAMGLLRIDGRVARATRLVLGRPRRDWFPVPTDGQPADIWVVESDDGKHAVVARPGGAPLVRAWTIVDDRPA